MKTPWSQLLSEYGIEESYVDGRGVVRAVPVAIQKHLLKALNGDGDVEPETALQALNTLKNSALYQSLPPVWVARGKEKICLPIRGTHQTRELPWRLQQEDGAVHTGVLDFQALSLRTGLTPPYEERCWNLPQDISFGYHTVTVGDGTMPLIVTPVQAYQGLPQAVREGQPPPWRGLSLQLYAERSATNWGIGDFTDLKNIIDAVVTAGLKIITLNPLYALFPDHPEEASPYFVSSRYFYNDLYVDITAVPEFALSGAAQALLQEAKIQKQWRQLREALQVDYAGVAALKRAFWPLLYEVFLEEASPERRKAFQDYQKKYAHRLSPLRSIIGPDGLGDYINFETQRQQQGAYDYASSRGIWLCQDLPIGVAPLSAEVSDHPEDYATTCRLGAPGDDFAPQGQGWNLIPFSPTALRAKAYRPFIELIQQAMASAHMLRLDHVVGLFRQFWYPADPMAEQDTQQDLEQETRSGGYVAFPLQDLLGIIALESHRHRCHIVGEDLGIVPSFVQEKLRERGIWGVSPLVFTRDGHNAPQAPENYPAASVASFGSHDLPPLAGYLVHTDLDQQRELNLLSAQTYQTALDQREYWREQLFNRLEMGGLLSFSQTASFDAITHAIHKFLFKTAAKIQLISLADLIGEVQPQNLPGTHFEYPNWRHKRPVPTPEVLKGNLFKNLFKV